MLGAQENAQGSGQRVALEPLEKRRAPRHGAKARECFVLPGMPNELNAFNGFHSPGKILRLDLVDPILQVGGDFQFPAEVVEQALHVHHHQGESAQHEERGGDGDNRDAPHEAGPLESLPCGTQHDPGHFQSSTQAPAPESPTGSTIRPFSR